jgi:hypothetical protein
MTPDKVREVPVRLVATATPRRQIALGWLPKGDLTAANGLDLLVVVSMNLGAAGWHMWGD